MPSARFFSFATLATFVAMVALISTQHRVRLIVETFQKIDSTGPLPGKPLTYMVAEKSTLAPSFDSAVSFLRMFEELHPLRQGDALPALDDPDTCVKLLMEGKPVHCYNADIGVCSMLAQQGVLARMWDLTGASELGGNGHNLLEIFDRNTNTWKALDPYYHCYFTRANDSVHAIDVPTLRMELLNGRENIRVVRYIRTSQDRPDSMVRREMRFLVPCSMLHANNDFRERYAERYGAFMPIASLLDRLPLRLSRGVRTCMMGSNDLRYIIEDSRSPHYPYCTMKWYFWGLFIACGTFLLLTIITMRDGRKKEKYQTS